MQEGKNPSKEYSFPLTPSEAVEYLEKERGLVFEVASLRNRRRYGTAQASRVLKQTTLWTKEELDAIKPSWKTRRVTLEGDSSSSVMLIRNDHTACLVRSA